MNKLKIVIADDHALLRNGLRLLINGQADMEMIGEAEDGEMAVKVVTEKKPEVVLMDISMPRLNGKQATEQLKRVLPHLKILALTRHTDTSYLQQLLRAGVDGYVLKQSDADELLRAIRSVVKSGKYLDPALSEKVMGTYVGRLNVRNTSRLGEVTEREEEILRFIAQGYSNKDIATRLDVSVKTVEAHKANAMNKLDLHSRVEIIRFAMLQGWLQDS